MDCVDEVSANKVVEKKNPELKGLSVTENKTGIQFIVTKVDYIVVKTRIRGKERILSYTVKVFLNNDDGHKSVKLEDFEKNYTYS